jgi:hypothetical protein
MIQANDFTRAKNLDVNGNSRQILHFLALTKEGDAPDGDISGKYVAALARARKLGGRKYHNKQYGGGIIFQSSDAQALADELNNCMRGPVVWQALWDAMKTAPGAWIETTEAMYWEMLGCMPPERMAGGKFLVGEPADHNERGEAVYACFKKLGARFYARYLTVSQFSYS